MKKYYLPILILLMVFLYCTKLADFKINTHALNLTINKVVIDTNTASITLQLNNLGDLPLANSGFYYDTNSINTSTSPKIDISTNNYSQKLISLVYGKKYYLRSFVQANGANEPVYYGQDTSFIIPYKIPTISITNFTNITRNSATVNVNFINYNNITIDSAGVAFSSSNNVPTRQNGLVALTNKGILTGNYNVSLSSLNANTTYYVRAYFYNNSTIYYGNVQTFTTSNLLTTLTLANLDSNMVSIPAGSFTMGATSEQLANNGDGYTVNWSPATQQVTLNSYKICRFEVTQQLWLDVMGSNPSNFTGNLQRPVENVSWDDCQTFINKLKQLTNKNYRLPTEAEWEYASRGGANSTYNFIYSGSNTANDVAWYGNNSSNQPHTVGTKQANALGIYDMTNNIREWCQDWYGAYSSVPVTNPQGPNSGSHRAVRGGSWEDASVRVSARGGVNTNFGHNRTGLRLVLDNTILPTITTNASTFITNTTATANISISNPNSLNITAAGIDYSSTNSTPTTTDNYVAHSSTGNLAGNYTLNLSNLTANTTYYVRGYINHNGTIYYGNVQTFTTTN